MEEIYEYKHRPNRKITWFAACCIGFLMGYGWLTSDPQILAVAWSLIAICLLWLLMKSPTAGIRLDDKTLTLAAWRTPQDIPLRDIDHVRIAHWTDHSDVTVVLRDGQMIDVPFGDLPDMNTLHYVLAERGVQLVEPDSLQTA